MTKKQGWYGDRHRHMMASKGIISQPESYGNGIEVINTKATIDINKQLKESAEKISNIVSTGSEYGIYDTASRDALYEYIQNMINLNILKLQKKSTTAINNHIILSNSYKDGTFNPFHIFTPYPEDKDSYYKDWENVSKNIQKVIDVETKKIAQKMFKYKPETINEESVKIITLKIVNIVGD